MVKSGNGKILWIRDDMGRIGKPMQNRKRISEICAFAVWSILIFILSFVIVEKQMAIQGTDYQIHAIQAIDIFQGGIWHFFREYPYPLWHLGVKFFERVFHFRLYEAAATTTALVYWVNFATNFGIMWFALGKQVNKQLCYIFSMMSIVVQPITLALFSGKVTWGISLINTWHNPTNVAARPFGVIAFYILCSAIHEWKSDNKISWKKLFVLSGVLVVANMGKPSFGQVFLPSITLFCVLWCVCSRFKNFKMCLAIATAFVVPAMQLLFQMFFAFGDGDGTVEIAWFDVICHLQPNIALMLLKYLLFPIAVTVYLRKNLKCDIEMQLAWLLWGVSFCEYAALAETGERRYHGNFGWGFSIANFILQFVSLVRLIAYLKETGKKAYCNVAVIVYAIQFICGCIYLWWLLSVELFWY